VAVRGYTLDMFRPSFIGLVYLVIGVAVAATHDYFERLNTLRLLVSALLAVLLWPLVLLGIDLHIKK
jgi:predicted transporter